MLSWSIPNWFQPSSPLYPFCCVFVCVCFDVVNFSPFIELLNRSDKYCRFRWYTTLSLLSFYISIASFVMLNNSCMWKNRFDIQASHNRSNYYKFASFPPFISSVFQRQLLSLLSFFAFSCITFSAMHYPPRKPMRI